MQAILITQPPNFELASVPDPSCGPGQVIIRTAYCGICGTDLEILRGAMPEGFARYPVVPGHEWTGVVEEVGSGVIIAGRAIAFRWKVISPAASARDVWRANSICVLVTNKSA